MSRILEREGVWNYVVSGALTMTFPFGSGFEPFSFWSLEVRQERAVDLRTIGSWRRRFRSSTSPSRRASIPIHYPFAPEDCVGSQRRTRRRRNQRHFQSQGRPADRAAGMSMDEALDRYLPNYRGRFANDFPPRIVTRLDTQLKYVPTGVLVAEEALEQFKGFQSRGLNAAQIYAQKIQPRLYNPN